MKFELTTKKTVDVEYLQVSAGARYCEDATVNGVEDENGDLIPFRNADYWEPKIHIETGKIVDWPKGTTASIHYKVCDDGAYKLLDSRNNLVKEIEGYVIDILCPEENGYGDYIIMEIDESGQIMNWVADLSDFK